MDLAQTLKKSRYRVESRHPLPLVSLVNINTHGDKIPNFLFDSSSGFNFSFLLNIVFSVCFFSFRLTTWLLIISFYKLMLCFYKLMSTWPLPYFTGLHKLPYLYNTLRDSHGQEYLKIIIKNTGLEPGTGKNLANEVLDHEVYINMRTLQWSLLHNMWNCDPVFQDCLPWFQ